MTEKVKKLQEERGKIWNQMKALNDRVDAEGRDFTGEEQTQYDKMNDEMTTLEKRIGREKELARIGSELNVSRGNPIENDLESVPKPKNKQEEIRGYVERFNRDGRYALKDEEFNDMQRDVFRRFLLTGKENLDKKEIRALQMDLDIYGGYLVTPQIFATELIKAIDNEVTVRPFATKQLVDKAASLGIVSLDNDPADPEWTKEIGIGTEDSTMSFGLRELHPHPLAKLIKVSEKLMRASEERAEAIVRERLAYKFAVVEENAFLNGTGANQPLGLMVASDDGVSTSRDVSTGNTATAITTDGLIRAKHKIKTGYWKRPGFRWLFHSDAVENIRLLKDGEGRYIWQPIFTEDLPDRILGVSILMSEYMPSTFETTCYVGLIGDLSFYHIADALDIRIQKLVELYAGTNQIGFIGRKETDGMPVLEEAFARVKLA